MPDARLTFTVTADDTALAVGSGSLPVLGTPRLIAWCEAATCAALEGSLAEGATSVGTEVELSHLVATTVGGRIVVTVKIIHRTDRRVSFKVKAKDGAGTVVARGRVERAIVRIDRFMARLESPQAH